MHAVSMAITYAGFFFRRSAPERNPSDTGRLLKWIVVGSVPTFFMGYFFKDWLKGYYFNPMAWHPEFEHVRYGFSKGY